MKHTKRHILKRTYGRQHLKKKNNSKKKYKSNLYFSHFITYTEPYTEIIKMNLFKRKLYTLLKEEDTI